MSANFSGSLNESEETILMITLSNNTKGFALLHRVLEIYAKVSTHNSLYETVLYWQLNCMHTCIITLYICMCSFLVEPEN